jgi:hypothetical protein
LIREEKLKKDQAINKLAEMMMRKDLQVRRVSSGITSIYNCVFVRKL